VDKPDKARHDKELQEISDAIDAIKAERQKVQDEIDAAMNDPESRSALGDLRTKMNAVKLQKNALIEEKKVMRNQLDATKNQTEKLIKDKKDTRSNIRFNTLEEIEAEVAKLKRQQETTTMSLNEEKRLIKEMEALQASKRFVVDLKNKDTAMDTIKDQRKTISAQIAVKDKEIDALTKEMNEVMEKIKTINDAESTKKDAIQGLYKKRDEFKKDVGAKLKEKDAIRDAFREENNAWFNYQRAVRAQKNLQYQEEKKKRDEEQAAYLSKVAEEEAKKIPYEEEQALCDYLADYLERTYLTGKTEESKETGKKQDIVAVKEDPFAGLTSVSKKGEDDEYFGKGKGKKKRVRTAKKQDQVAGPFTISVDTFEQFGLLALSPPTSIEQVPNSIKELREKKEFYKQQPRGSVPTAADIRKANEKAAAKQRQSESSDDPSQTKGQTKGSFSLSADEFAPLGAGGASMSVNSSWGKPGAPAQEAS
jgi:uncharacterized coiled-coil DUF342 family protein